MKANGKVRDILTMYRPIAAVIGGFQAAPGRIMGHAGAWTGLGEVTSESKYKALEGAGVTMVDHPAKFGSVMRDILAKSGRSVNRIVRSNAFPRQITKCELTSSRSNQQLKSNNAVHTTHHASHAVRSHHRRPQFSNKNGPYTSMQTKPPPFSKPTTSPSPHLPLHPRPQPTT